MLMFLAKLQTWRFWIVLVVFITLFAPPILVSTYSFYDIMQKNAKKITLALGDVSFTIESKEVVSQLEKIYDKQLLAQLSINTARNEINKIPEKIIVLKSSSLPQDGRLLGAYSSGLSELQSSVATTLTKVSSIEIVPKIEFEKLHKRIDKLKKMTDERSS